MSTIPEHVVHYIVSMKEIITQDKQANKDIFENEFIDNDVWWSIFETKVMINYANNGNPAITPEQFKEVHIEAMKISIEETLQSLVDKGLAKETPDGFKSTQDGIKVCGNKTAKSDKKIL
jgi:hypothetical protein